MHKPFDATLNRLIDARPDEWANHFGQLVGIPPGPSHSLDTDLATTIQADRIFLIEGPSPAVLHLELEANGRLGIPKEVARYNTVIAHPHDIPVLSLLVLLRPSAFASDMTGVYVRRDSQGRLISEFHYFIEKVWKRSIDHWLNCGPGLSVLALLTDEAGGGLDKAVGRLWESLREKGVEKEFASDVFGSGFILCGLRYEEERLLDIFRSYSMLLEESTTYQYLIRKGIDQGIEKGIEQGTEMGLQALRKAILSQGSKRFGNLPAGKAVALQKINDLDQLEMLLERILDAHGWDDLLG